MWAPHTNRTPQAPPSSPASLSLVRFSQFLSLSLVPLSLPSPSTQSLYLSLSLILVSLISPVLSLELNIDNHKTEQYTQLQPNRHTQHPPFPIKQFSLTTTIDFIPPSLSISPTALLLHRHRGSSTPNSDTKHQSLSSIPNSILSLETSPHHQ